MVEPFFHDLERNGLFDPRRDRILLAVSGGRDSSLLAHFCHEMGLDFGIAHVNFQLRGDESDGDELFVKEMADRFSVPFFLKKEDAAATAAAQKCSIQEAARQIRYAFFEKTRAENGFRYIATAHHLSDNVETALLNFVRGTGLRGLRGMLPIQGNIIRPFLEVKTWLLHYDAEILRAELEIEWREDRSNATDDYSRNFLRESVRASLARYP